MKFFVLFVLILKQNKCIIPFAERYTYNLPHCELYSDLNSFSFETAFSLLQNVDLLIPSILAAFA